MNPIARNATLVAIELRKLDGKLSRLAAEAFDEAAKEIERLETRNIDLQTKLNIASGRAADDSDDCKQYAFYAGSCSRGTEGCPGDHDKSKEAF